VSRSVKCITDDWFRRRSAAAVMNGSGKLRARSHLILAVDLDRRQDEQSRRRTALARRRSTSRWTLGNYEDRTKVTAIRVSTRRSLRSPLTGSVLTSDFMAVSRARSHWTSAERYLAAYQELGHRSRGRGSSRCLDRGVGMLLPQRCDHAFGQVLGRRPRKVDLRVWELLPDSADRFRGVTVAP
jgi:hypothetical protein